MSNGNITEMEPSAVFKPEEIKVDKKKLAALQAQAAASQRVPYVLGSGWQQDTPARNESRDPHARGAEHSDFDLTIGQKS